MPGLEISSLAVIDIEANTAPHPECGQTPANLPDNKSRIDFYVEQVIRRSKELEELADYLVYDGAAAKKKFIDGIVDNTDPHLISKLRNNADMRYLYTGPKKPGPGRPKQYDGRIRRKDPEINRFDLCFEDDEIVI